MQQKSAVRAVSLRPMHIIGDYRVPGGIATQKEAESHRESRWDGHADRVEALRESRRDVLSENPVL